ncbi:hypothetical protein H5410_015795 [Solanum commersonii]|uniref:Uncharacterized protein n=1 Tax=Solanum commersonii TaxID=4109 RepID=A0A9J5ZV45_SOLCO|nr:hypothetical protein H5410_015795 [Solanum commersonii]
MENSAEQKVAIIKRFIDTTLNVGRKEILDGFTTRSRVVIEKEATVATRSNATTSLTHGVINSLQPCLLASSKPLPVMSLTPFAKCVNHGFAAYISLEDVQNSENYTHINVNIGIRMLEDANVNVPILDLVPTEETEIDMIKDNNGVLGGCWIQLIVHVPVYIFMTIRTDRDRDI